MNQKRLNILLADDDIDDCTFFKEALESLPLVTQLQVVFDGHQLMNHLSENSEELPDVVFLDLNMPRKNGFECLSEIKRDEKLRNLPVIVFSTSNSIEKINSLFSKGAHVYIHKPSDFNQLVEVISHALPLVAGENYSTQQVNYILNA